MSQNFSDRLRTARTAKGLSQADLARKTGFEPSAISHFETDERSPSFKNLARLADALNVSIDYLLGRVAEPQAAGPVADKLFRDFRNLSASDQDTLAQMADFLAKKNAERQGSQSKSPEWEDRS